LALLRIILIFILLEQPMAHSRSLATSSLDDGLAVFRALNLSPDLSSSDARPAATGAKVFDVVNVAPGVALAVFSGPNVASGPERANFGGGALIRLSLSGVHASCV